MSEECIEDTDDSKIIQVNIRMSYTLKKKCLEQADRHNRSLQQWICSALENQLELESEWENDEFKTIIREIKEISDSQVIPILKSYFQIGSDSLFDSSNSSTLVKKKK